MAFYRDNTDLLFAGYWRQHKTEWIMPDALIRFSQQYYDKTFYWTLCGDDLNAFISSDVLTATTPSKGDHIKLSNGKNGIIKKFGLIYDDELIGIEPEEPDDDSDVDVDADGDEYENEAASSKSDNDDVIDDGYRLRRYGGDDGGQRTRSRSWDAALAVGSYGKLQNLTGHNAKYNDIVVKCTRFKYQHSQKQVLVQDNEHIYIILQDQVRPLHDFVEYKASIMQQLNNGDTIWRASNDCKLVASLSPSSDCRLLTHGNPMYLERINFDNILLELLIFPIGDEFGRSFAMCYVRRLPGNVSSITAVFTFACNRIDVEYPSQTVSLFKDGEVIQWDSVCKYASSAQWKRNYAHADDLRFTFDVKILDVEFKQQQLQLPHMNAYHSMMKLFQPIYLKERLILEIYLFHNERVNVRLREMDEPLVFHQDQNWRFFLNHQQRCEDDLTMSIELMLLPPKIVAVELNVVIGNEHVSNGKKFVFGNDGYDNLCTVAFSKYHNQCSVFEVGIYVLKVINTDFEEVPRDKWSEYNIAFNQQQQQMVMQNMQNMYNNMEIASHVK
eukprot:CAMPEP_0202690820 /NCGR_PEP_ID=MMETSP1385-20130828/5709_1 /ASSEMBLY_ACC=CAM_ASM_000861 /TAXON_ID=933848 /ORGANISM="Elphidium margaritaceum" /LENGTH=555 /DNA_ID=CAMNT_0049346131 /DNA_START=58 /DNA_END=1725 /DNA_ORIENTATION=-